MSTALRTYYRGDELVGMRDGPGNKSIIFHFDHQGTTQCLTDRATGAVTDRFASDAWGVQVKRTGTSINRQWYIGNWGYVLHGLHSYYVRHRYAQSLLGRWMSQDPVRRSTDPQYYLYANNSPPRQTDPSGMYCELLFGPNPDGPKIECDVDCRFIGEHEYCYHGYGASWRMYWIPKTVGGAREQDCWIDQWYRCKSEGSDWHYDWAKLEEPPQYDKWINHYQNVTCRDYGTGRRCTQYDDPYEWRWDGGLCCLQSYKEVCEFVTCVCGLLPTGKQGALSCISWGFEYESRGCKKTKCEPIPPKRVRNPFACRSM